MQEWPPCQGSKKMKRIKQTKELRAVIATMAPNAVLKRVYESDDCQVAVVYQSTQAQGHTKGMLDLTWVLYAYPDFENSKKVMRVRYPFYKEKNALDSFLMGYEYSVMTMVDHDNTLDPKRKANGFVIRVDDPDVNNRPKYSRNYGFRHNKG